MAERDNILAKIKYESPTAFHLITELERQAIKAGCTGASVITTENMTVEEKEMALYEGFIKEGYLPEEANRKAKEWLVMFSHLF